MLTDSLHTADEASLRARLAELVRATNWLMDALRAVRGSVDAPWCIGAGAIRTSVWDHLHGYPMSVPDDVDVAFFDPGTPAAEDHRIAEKLIELQPRWQWDVVNQAHAHTLSGIRERKAFLSLGDAIACWPETATAVGVWLNQSEELHVVAPHGLRDLFGLVLRVSPRLRDFDVFEQRCFSKRWRERWPMVTIVGS